MPNSNLTEIVLDDFSLNISKNLVMKEIRSNSNTLRIENILNNSAGSNKPMVRISIVTDTGRYLKIFIDFVSFKDEIEKGLELIPGTKSVTIDFISMHSPACQYYFNYTNYDGWKIAPTKGWREKCKKNENSPLQHLKLSENNIAFIQKPDEWNQEIFCYAYSADNSAHFNASWPGRKMAASPDQRIYSLLITIPNPLIVFTDGIHIYPNQEKSGYTLKGSMILRNGIWEPYQKVIRSQNSQSNIGDEKFHLADKAIK